MPEHTWPAAVAEPIGHARSSLPAATVAALLSGQHPDPFSVLGRHDVDGRVVARALLPGADGAEAHDLHGNALGLLRRVDPGGLFEGPLEGAASAGPLRYHCRAGPHDWSVTDAYSFGPVLTEEDDAGIAQGIHPRLFDKLGAHPLCHQRADGVHFAVWAPGARLVSLVGDCNGWNPTCHVMRLRHRSGVWEIFLPGVGEGCAYKFHIVGSDGETRPWKADPFAFAAELRPRTASIVARPGKHDWGDAAHRTHRERTDPRREPIAIYEVHAGSWDRDENGWYLTWDALAERLIPYVLDLGFTHIELLPISEHPYDPSWGYQTTGLYAPSARFGDPEGFARFVDGAHRAGLGIILDWVPAHFPADPHGLVRFDGTALYEHDDPRLGFHPDWNTLIYNFGRREVAHFLVANALFWAEHYHVDGLRVDAVASMLYRDYSRNEGEWLPNAEGGRENWEAVDFLRAMNRAVYAAHPGFFTVAEESTAWPGVSAPAFDEGARTNLGFGFKWNMGFMHDTLRYMARDAIHRRFHHDDLTFGLVYAFNENFVLPLSHDEVVHGKGSLLAKMSGDDWQKFANLRAYYALMWGYPGKKLLFMGQEFAQRREWSESRALDWELREAPAHEGVRTLLRDLNRVYRACPALHARDCEREGFAWAVADDADASVFAWVRHAPGAPPVAVVSNLTPQPREGYRLPLPREGTWREIINSDAGVYGGSGMGNMGAVEAEHGHATVTLPPLATVMFLHQPSGVSA